jgi:phosphate acetyltransferase
MSIWIICKKLSSFEAEGMTQKMFQYNLVKRAKKHRKHIVLPEGMTTELYCYFRLLSMDVVDISILEKTNRK